ncbi:MAG TPA: 4Fe-4S single cluster domain-containing protein [Burkholderiaceae bacterium]
MKIAVNKAHFPVTVLGPGRRIGIWVQGCSIGCKGCISRDTWPRDAGSETTVARLLTWCRELAGDAFDGVTISGGEPFDQPAALSALLDGLAHWRESLASDFDILCYSGYPLARLQKKHARLLQKLDALIPEPFVENLPMSHLWRGSANQPLIALSERGTRKYSAHVDAAAAETGKQMQIMVEGSKVWFVGIPARGDMQALEDSCRERGIAFERASWRQ